MQNNQQKKATGALFLSIIMHLVLLALLVLGSFYTHIEIMGGGEGEGEVIGAVMVDTGSAAQEWGRLKSQKLGQTQNAKKEPTPVDDQEKQEEIIKKQQLERQELQKQEQERQLAEQQKQQEEKAKQEALKQQKLMEEATAKKAAEAARLKAEAEAKRLEAAAKQAEEEKKAKLAEEVKRKEEAKKKAEEAAKAEKLKAEADAKAKAEKEKAKAAAEKAKAEAKAKADAAKRKAEQGALDDFLNSGDIGGGSATKDGNINKQGSQGSGAALGSGDGGKTGDQYAGVIKKEIQRRFLREPSFANKVCTVEIELDRDGTIISYRRVSGPDDICSAAMSAVARTKKVPPAPTDEIYSKYKKVPLDFTLTK